MCECLSSRFKLKPNLATSCTLDLAVVAILYGQGSEGKDLYLLAARDESERVSLSSTEVVGVAESDKIVIVGTASVGLNQIDKKRLYEVR